jgi:2-hydroxychromene-2-carboxylate isomerase
MSPYSWISAERIEPLLAEARWRGVLAGALFKASGRTSWGLTGRREEGIADCEARAAAHGLGPMRWPERWPTSDLLVARAMIFAERAADGVGADGSRGDPQGLLKPFALAAMRLAFLQGCDLADPDVVLEAGRHAGIDPQELGSALTDPTIKDGLRTVTDEALALGVFGVPTVAVGLELFWGDDRLEDAAHAYRGLGPAGAAD